MKTIDKDTLKEKLEKEDVILIDVLDPEEFNKSHIKGAINIPLQKIASEAKKRFKPGDMIVVYCSNKACTASPTAARKLEEVGFTNVHDFEGGKQEWKDAGLPME
jgi:rhodanese-related sulfurtransferase